MRPGTRFLRILNFRTVQVILHFGGVGDFGIVKHLPKHVYNRYPNIARWNVIRKRIELGIGSLGVEILLLDIVEGQLGDIVEVHLHLLPLERLFPVILEKKHQHRKDEKNRREINKKLLPVLELEHLDS